VRSRGWVWFLVATVVVIAIAECAYALVLHGRMPRVLLAVLLLDGLCVIAVAWLRPAQR
jgi:hypothetical protein